MSAASIGSEECVSLLLKAKANAGLKDEVRLYHGLTGSCHHDEVRCPEREHSTGLRVFPPSRASPPAVIAASSMELSQVRRNLHNHHII